MSQKRAQLLSQFKKQLYFYYIVNVLGFIVFGCALFLAQRSEYYRESFVVLVALFLLWIFNIDKLCRCPFCHGNPRGKQGLFFSPKKCAACGEPLL